MIPYGWICWICQDESLGEDDMADLPGRAEGFCRGCWSRLEPSQRAWIALALLAGEHIPPGGRLDPSDN